MYSELNIRISNLEETQKFAAILSKLIAKPFFICLNGPIGSGKTTFAKLLINQFSEKKINVPSPTFPIVQIYDLKKIKIWHYDLFRVENKKEFFNLDFDIAITDCVIVEWPNIFLDFFPKNRIELDFFDKDLNVREIVVKLVGNHIMKDNLWRILKKR